jgi:hypothetical protein
MVKEATFSQPGTSYANILKSRDLPIPDGLRKFGLPSSATVK